MRKALNWTVLVAALGYFVDMFDLTVFGVVRLASLKGIGIVDPQALTEAGVRLVNLQALGMLIGGVLWGVLADKKGRLSVLFASILIYSTANVLNAFVETLLQYEILRFVAGVGLAGELGAAVTLVSEMLGKEDRGYGTTVIAALGLLGAVTASVLGQMLSWQTTYLLGGALGFGLLFARFRMVDSRIFERVEREAPRGDLRLLLTGSRLRRYLACIAVGVPIYFITGILFTFAPELSGSLGLTGITAGNALLFGSIGLTVGDLASGVLSQKLRSRKRSVYLSLTAGFLFTLLYAFVGGVSNEGFYSICFALGLAAGYWAVLVTVAAEQFGTNIRATAATSVPNFVRSSVIIMTSTFSALKGQMGLIPATLVIAVAVFALAAFALSRLRETYGLDLDFVDAWQEGAEQVNPATSPVERPSVFAGLPE